MYLLIDCTLYADCVIVLFLSFRLAGRTLYRRRVVAARALVVIAARRQGKRDRQDFAEFADFMVIPFFGEAGYGIY
jgi:hypothetical protein